MEPISIYIHIPFCIRKCFYCAFTSMRPKDRKNIDAYFDALWCEIKHYADLKQSHTVRTVYVGGGTPSAVAESYIRKTMDVLAATFGFDPGDVMLEKTIEVNPESVDAKKLAAYRAMGFNRLSMGLQTGNDALLKAIGRPHDWADFYRAYHQALDVGFTNISVDVMLGLPGQTMTDLDETLTQVLALPALKHISCYSLTVEPDTTFEKMQRQGRLVLPDEETERLMYHHMVERLAEDHLEQYEISNFARKGFASRHNSSYWDLTPYLGLGLGASSYYKGSRWTNTVVMADYVAMCQSGEAPIEESHVLLDDEKRGDFMFLGLRRTAGVSDADYIERFGNSYIQDYGSAIDGLCCRGLLQQTDERLCLTALGMDLANQVFMAFV